MYKKLIYLLFIVTCVSTSQAFAQSAERNWVMFEKIDNAAEIWVDNQLVYESGKIERNPELEIKVLLDAYIVDGTESITIKLINGNAGGALNPDKHWEIRYELFLNEQPVDYIWEYADDFKNGVAYEKNYLIDEWQ